MGIKQRSRSYFLAWGSKTSVDREDFFGDLQGVMNHLDYLTDLGINGIYFCPIFKATSNHKVRHRSTIVKSIPRLGDKNF